MSGNKNPKVGLLRWAKEQKAFSIYSPIGLQDQHENMIGLGDWAMFIRNERQWWLGKCFHVNQVPLWIVVRTSTSEKHNTNSDKGRTGDAHPVNQEEHVACVVQDNPAPKKLLSMESYPSITTLLKLLSTFQYPRRTQQAGIHHHIMLSGNSCKHATKELILFKHFIFTKGTQSPAWNGIAPQDASAWHQISYYSMCLSLEATEYTNN